ncbi:MAG: hypothetical protein AAB729_01395, partial [Patescibacteria group bacterium]
SAKHSQIRVFFRICRPFKDGKKDKLWAAITTFGGLFNINSFWYNLTTVLTRLIEIFCLIERI